MILMGSCGNTDNEHHHRPQLKQEHGLRHAISSSLDQDVIMALVGSTDLPDNMGPASVGFLDSNTAPGIGPVCLFLLCLFVLIFYFYYFYKFSFWGNDTRVLGRYRDWEMVRLGYIM